MIRPAFKQNTGISAIVTVLLEYHNGQDLQSKTTTGEWISSQIRTQEWGKNQFIVVDENEFIYQKRS